MFQRFGGGCGEKLPDDKDRLETVQGAFVASIRLGAECPLHRLAGHDVDKDSSMTGSCPSGVRPH